MLKCFKFLSNFNNYGIWVCNFSPFMAGSRFRKENQPAFGRTPSILTEPAVMLMGPGTARGDAAQLFWVISYPLDPIPMPHSWLGYDLRLSHPEPRETHRPLLVMLTLTPCLKCCPVSALNGYYFSLSKSITKFVGRTMAYFDFRNWPLQLIG